MVPRNRVGEEVRRAFAGLLAVVLFLALGLFSSLAVASTDSANSKGFAQVAGCVAGARNLLVDFVVDESGSLKQTDPEDDRVKGLLTAIDSLQAFQAHDEHLQIHVALSAFADGFDTLRGWSALSPSTGAALRRTASAQLPKRNTGTATDYRQAMIQGQKQLDARAHDLGDPAACKLMLFFTDGALDVGSATAEAETQLCQPGGILDSIRRDGVTVVALALFAPNSGVSELQRQQLEALATGSGSSTRCGTQPIPSGAAQGIYLPATNAGELQRIFAEIGIAIQGGTPQARIHCASTQCPNGHYSFAFDAGLHAIDLVVQSPGYANGAPIRLMAPDGKELTLGDGQSVTRKGVTVTASVLGSFATVDLVYRDFADRVTTWRFDPPGDAEIDTYTVWGAYLRPVPSHVTAGRTNEVAFELVDRHGRTIPASLYKSSALHTTANGRSIDAALRPDGQLVATLPVGVNDIPASYVVQTTLSVRTEPHGYHLGPISTSSTFKVHLPPAYPLISPQALTFPRANGDVPESATLDVQGSKLGATRVCLAGSAVVVPGQSSSTGLLSASPACVSLARGQHSQLRVTLRPGASEDGIATGTASFSLSGAQRPGVTRVSVPLTMPMSRVVDSGKRWLLILILVGAAILLPYLLLVGANLLLARFEVVSTSRVFDLPVDVRPPAGIATPTAAELARYTNPGRSIRARSMDLGSLGASMVTLRSRRVFGLGHPVSRAVVPDGYSIVSSLQPYTTQSPHQAPVNPGNLDAAFVVLSPLDEGSPPRGRLIMVVPSEVDAAGVAERAHAVCSRPDWSHILKRHEEAAAEKAARQPANVLAGSGGRGRNQGTSSTPPDDDADSSSISDGILPGASASRSTSTEVDIPGESLPGAPHSRPGHGEDSNGGSRRRRSQRSGRGTTPDGGGGDSAPPPDDLPELPDFLK